ncbi:MAG: hypothetical protein ABF296_12325 [Oceanococcaceae bacterium]
MADKPRILPKWVAHTKLHDGWHFAGVFRMPGSAQDWVAGARWPEALPLVLTCAQAERGRLQLEITLEAQAALPCQRCGELLDWQETITQAVLLVAEEDAQNPQAQWEVVDDRVEFEALLTQELSLHLPDFPRHTECDLQGMADAP